jgi:ABC-2 type transport system ATP-binding protein
MIQVGKLTKFYNGKPAIEEISFSIEQGEIVGLLGLNGAGKSTILKILGCFLMPSLGSASIAGYSTEDHPHMIRSLIGYLPDVPPLYGEMTVSSYLRYVAQLKGVGSANLQEHVDEAMQKTNLGDVGEDLIGGLSHGYRQRVGIAQAIVHKPKVLILDEPINGLDPVQIVEMRDLIISLRKAHTVILSSHILSEITRTCDRILIVDHGRLVAEGNAEQLQQSASSGLRVRCELASSVKVDALVLPAGARATAQRSTPQGGFQIDFELERDSRAELAKVLVASGAGLVAMQRSSDALEDLFMKFVKG